jgi:hypothetical protein
MHLYPMAVFYNARQDNAIRIVEYSSVQYKIVQYNEIQ